MDGARLNHRAASAGVSRDAGEGFLGDPIAAACLLAVFCAIGRQRKEPLGRLSLQRVARLSQREAASVLLRLVLPGVIQ